MDEIVAAAREIMTLFFIAVALGMSSFSVGIGMGRLHIRRRTAAKIGEIFGLFNILMALSGITMGRVLSGYFGIANMVGGIMLVFLGSHMIFSSFQKDPSRWLRSSGVGLFVMAFVVSIDTFSVGLGLGFYGAKIIIAIAIFGATSMILTWVGFFLGRKFQGSLGRYGEAFGGCILFIFGLKLLFII